MCWLLMHARIVYIYECMAIAREETKNAQATLMS